MAVVVCPSQISSDGTSIPLDCFYVYKWIGAWERSQQTFKKCVQMIFYCHPPIEMTTLSHNRFTMFFFAEARGRSSTRLTRTSDLSLSCYIPFP